MADGISIVVLQDAPAAVIMGDRIVQPNMPVTFTSSVTQRFGSIVKYRWGLGPQSAGYIDSTGATFAHAFSVETTTTVRLEVEDDDGNKDTATKDIVVLAKGPFVPQKSGKMILIPRGFFVDDVDTGWNGDTAIVTHDFWMDTTEVTQEDFQAVMGYNPSTTKLASHPMETVSWYEALMYCNARSKAEGMDTVYTYDTLGRFGALNIACHWTVAAIVCRQRTNGSLRRAAATNLGLLQPTARWPADAAKPMLTCATVKLCLLPAYPPSPYNLYDMTGNVEEWCWDYGDIIITSDRINGRINYRGGSIGSSAHRILKGGGSLSGGSVGSRNSDEPANRSSRRGFRVVRNYP